MEGHVLPAEVVGAVKRKRHAYPPEVIEKAVTEARHSGAQAAANSVNKNLAVGDRVPEETIRTWLHRWKTEGSFWQGAKKRGRKSIGDKLPDNVQKEWLKQVEAVRASGSAVTGRVAAVLGRGVVGEMAPSLLERHGGDLKVCVRTGQRMLDRADMSYRKRTSKRVLPPSADLENTRDNFYDNIAENFADGPPPPDLVLNFDQTFQLFNPNRGYTWEKKGADRVQLKEFRDGFTLVPVCSMTKMIGAQLIFGGTTSAVLPPVDPGKLLLYNYNANHWSNESTTLQLWNKIILPYIADVRRRHENDSMPALVLADAFAAHWTPAVKSLVESVPNISYICIPDCLTHIFQPLDLGIIPAFKQSILRRKDEFLEAETQKAVKEGRTVQLPTSRPVLRDRVTAWIKEIVADPIICAERCCRSGFVRSGVNRVLYGDTEGIDVDRHTQPSDIDYTVFVCDECGEHGNLFTSVPPCQHFVSVKRTVLCDGCRYNHTYNCDD